MHTDGMAGSAQPGQDHIQLNLRFLSQHVAVAVALLTGPQQTSR